MTAETVLDLARQGVYYILIVSGPLLLLALAVGLIISIFQAATQIQEQTLAFIPKIVAVFLGIILFGPWMISHMVQYATEIFSNLTRFVG
jgi:flagellar biosynthetic protein FliQ